MEAKYYTPEIEEFHSGFEFEYFYQNQWHKHNLDGSPIIHHELDEFKDDLMKIAHAITRVKHLDREGIEELGWKQKGEKEFELNRFSLFINFNIFFSFPDVDEITILNTRNEVVFKGTILNKSELRKIMKQLNIQGK